MMFQILKQLCRTMPPNSLRSPIEKSLEYSFSKIHNTIARGVEEPQLELFVRQLDLIGEALEFEGIHEANRTLLCQIIEGYFPLLNEDNVVSFFLTQSQ